MSNWPGFSQLDRLSQNCIFGHNWHRLLETDCPSCQSTNSVKGKLQQTESDIYWDDDRSRREPELKTKAQQPSSGLFPSIDEHLHVNCRKLRRQETSLNASLWDNNNNNNGTMATIQVYLYYSGLPVLSRSTCISWSLTSLFSTSMAITLQG